jgi:hypothetical protein
MIAIIVRVEVGDTVVYYNIIRNNAGIGTGMVKV